MEGVQGGLTQPHEPVKNREYSLAGHRRGKNCESPWDIKEIKLINPK